jgi:hypothetical protein
MSDEIPEKKVMAQYPTLQEGPASPATERNRRRTDPEYELPPPTFRQALVGYGSIMLGLVLLGLLIGVLMKVLR